ncbi:MAG: hypothetical protein GX660_12325, partial [Clostridiaceae bacterium]|nr:hypothetical protein [Clostridiaceae bacterium]
MKIKFIKNKDEEYCNMKVLNDNEILLTSNKESKYDNILAEKYYKFNLKFKSYEEILPEIEKLDVIVIEDISGIKNLIYFCTCTDLGNGKQIISFLSYDVEAKITKEIFEIEDTISLYPFEKTITTYVLDENYLLIQEGYLKSNLAGNFSAILDFKLY